MFSSLFSITIIYFGIVTIATLVAIEIRDLFERQNPTFCDTTIAEHRIIDDNIRDWQWQM